MDESLICTSCRRPHSIDARLWKCVSCGAPLELTGQREFSLAEADKRDRSIWRYRHLFPVGGGVEPVSLGEGGTPMIDVWNKVAQRRPRVLAKLDYLNPTGSFKDRGIAVLMTALRASRVPEAVEDSSGNAGASFAAYAARADIRARVFVPEAASPAKLRQIEVHGATVVRVLGPRSNAAEAARHAAEGGTAYASHVYSPFNIAGLATAAYEIWEQLGYAPQWIICPAGHGTFLLGLSHGFSTLHAAGLIEKFPRLIGVQASACAPMWLAHRGGPDSASSPAEGHTIAEGIRISQPVHSTRVLAAIGQSGGDVLAVQEAEIRRGQSELARLGLYVEPTSAVVWAALGEIMQRATPEETIVVMLTGSGLKSPLP